MERCKKSRASVAPAAPRLAFRLVDVAMMLSLSRSTIERERSAARFPPPDVTVGRAPLWIRETLERWLQAEAAGWADDYQRGRQARKRTTAIAATAPPPDDLSAGLDREHPHGAKGAGAVGGLAIHLG